jgi:hypothetical protein
MGPIPSQHGGRADGFASIVNEEGDFQPRNGVNGDETGARRSTEFKGRHIQMMALGNFFSFIGLSV